MIHSRVFLDECKRRDVSLFTGTPCSYLRPFINYVIDDDELDFVETTNEGDAVALASGAWLGGRKSVVMFQNSGLGNAVNPLTSLSAIMRIPFIGIVTLRGDPTGASDEPQHELMGAITCEMLALMKIPWAYFPQEETAVLAALDLAEKSCDETGLPFFFVMKKGAVQDYELKVHSQIRELARYETQVKGVVNNPLSALVTRTQALEVLKKSLASESIFIGTTGKTGRELFELGDSANHLYMVGSMGCALAMGVGLCQTSLRQKVCVIDGDGALLMRMGNMALAGQLRPDNLIHVLLDNGVHDSTGGQRSFSEFINFAEVATACGYQHVYECADLDDFSQFMAQIQQSKGLSFIRLMIGPGSPSSLGRPSVTPYEVGRRLKSYIEDLNARINS